MSEPSQIAPHSGSYLRDSYIFEWRNLSLRADSIFTVAIAICLFTGIFAGHPGAGLIAAAGATTVGFGAKQSIDDSRLRPMIFSALGISFSTFVGMVSGHPNYFLVLLVMLWGFGCGLLSARPEGYVWVGQQCVVFLLISSAFPAHPKAAAIRAAVTLAGGMLQVICAALLLKMLRELRSDLTSLAQYVRTEELLLRAALFETHTNLRRKRFDDPYLRYAARLAITLGIGTAIYTRLHFASGYWIPMTSLLVLKPGLSDTTSHAIARTAGTIGGAILASFCIAHLGASDYVFAIFTLIFAWLAYSTVDVNYALFSVFLTSNIVFLLALAGADSQIIAERRAVCTFIGGAIALTVRLLVLRRKGAFSGGLPAAWRSASEKAGS